MSHSRWKTQHDFHNQFILGFRWSWVGVILDSASPSFVYARFKYAQFKCALFDYAQINATLEPALRSGQCCGEISTTLKSALRSNRWCAQLSTTLKSPVTYKSVNNCYLRGPMPMRIRNIYPLFWRTGKRSIDLSYFRMILEELFPTPTSKRG